jgi:hypothetical protein
MSDCANRMGTAVRPRKVRQIATDIRHDGFQMCDFCTRESHVPAGHVLLIKCHMVPLVEQCPLLVSMFGTGYADAVEAIPITCCTRGFIMSGFIHVNDVQVSESWRMKL